MFRFKQFSIDQTGCAMKINTDGVLLGAMAEANEPARILDIGTGTGVIALMVAQRYRAAQIDAVEIDATAAETAERNFGNSVFWGRLNIHPVSIDEFLGVHIDAQFDLIISNPPFYLNSLESPEEKKSIAKHTDASFFEMLIKDISRHLSENGVGWLIFPFQEYRLVQELAKKNGMYLQKTINIHSFEESAPHRQIVCLGFDRSVSQAAKFVIYSSKGVYTDAYKELLQPYFINF